MEHQKTGRLPSPTSWAKVAGYDVIGPAELERFAPVFDRFAD